MASSAGALTAVGDGLISVIVSPRCAVCDVLLDRPTAGPVCDACWSAIRAFTPPYCPVCGDPLPAGRLSSALAARCGNEPTPLGDVAAWILAARSNPPPALPAFARLQSFSPWSASFDEAGSALPLPACPRCRDASTLIACSRAIGDYGATLRAIVHLLKYGGRRSLASRLATLMAAHGHEVLCGADAAVPVPLHWRRKWRRGFNQAALLAAGLGLPVWDAVARVRATTPQVQLAAAERRRNVRKAFAIARRKWPWQEPWRARLEGKIVVIVDDVSTTGSTLEACAEVLREAGAREVRALTAARVVRRE